MGDEGKEKRVSVKQMKSTDTYSHYQRTGIFSFRWQSFMAWSIPAITVADVPDPRLLRTLYIISDGIIVIGRSLGLAS